MKHEFRIITLSETGLTEHHCDRYGIDGYNADHNFRPNRADGGVSLYIKDFIEHTIRDELCFQNKTFGNIIH